MHADSQSWLSRYLQRYVSLTFLILQLLLLCTNKLLITILKILLSSCQCYLKQYWMLSRIFFFFFFEKELCLCVACISFHACACHLPSLFYALNSSLMPSVYCINICHLLPLLFFLSPSSRFLCGLNFKLFSLFYFPHSAVSLWCFPLTVL